MPPVYPSTLYIPHAMSCDVMNYIYRKELIFCLIPYGQPTENTYSTMQVGVVYCYIIMVGTV